MRKFTYAILTVIFVFIIILILNFDVTTKQCINYACRENKIPLYLKVIDFFDRHYNYKQLVKNITEGTGSDDERALKILEWTITNIKRVPSGLPIVDDHVFHIIIRGYGADDQYQDVFTTLCNYAGSKAFFILVSREADAKKKPLSFVKLSRGWSVFDAYNGVYFKNKNAEIASFKDLLTGNWQVVILAGGEIPDYQGYFKGLGSVNFKNWEFSRAAIQSPFRRIIFWKKFNK